jgi:thymidylate kinase
LKPKKGLSRTGKIKDRIERRAVSYHRRVRNGYIEMAKVCPKRIKLIKVDKNKEAIQLK